MNNFRLGAIGMAVLTIPIFLTGGFYNLTIAFVWGVAIAMLNGLGSGRFG